MNSLIHEILCGLLLLQENIGCISSLLFGDKPYTWILEAVQCPYILADLCVTKPWCCQVKKQHRNAKMVFLCNTKENKVMGRPGSQIVVFKFPFKVASAEAGLGSMAVLNEIT